MENHNENFEKIKAHLHEQGYHEKDVTITSGKAMTLGVFYALPFVIVIGLLYRFLLVERACLLEVSGLSFYIIFIWCFNSFCSIRFWQRIFHFYISGYSVFPYYDC